MALYFFHLRNTVTDIWDVEGAQAVNLDAAKNVALRAARDTMSQDMKEGRLDLRFRIEVEDAGHNLVHTLRLADAFQLIR